MTEKTTALSTQATATGPAPARVATPLQIISQTLDSEAYAPKIAASLDGTGISPERFKRAALAALSRPEAKFLVDTCDRGSIYAALMSAATLGLELNPALGQGYLIPRGGQAVLQIGFKGLIALAQRHPSISAIDTGVIRENDDATVEEGTHPRLVIRRSFGKNRGEIVAFYCVTQYAGGAVTLTLMDRAEVEKIRDKFSDAFKRGGAAAKPWKDEFEEMGKKTVVRRASKLWPIAIPSDGDEDSNSSTPASDTITGLQCREIRDLIRETASDEAKLLAIAKAGSVEEITPANFGRIRQLLVDKKNRATAAVVEDATIIEGDAA